jgi:heptaprenyl diphosphate synthase
MAMMTALAFVLSWIEHMFPPLLAGVPGIKLGLANVVVLMMLYVGDVGQAAVISLVRVLMVGLVFAGPSTMPYGLAGGALSLGAMALMKRTGWVSPVGVSMLGGVCHNVGQIAMAMLILGSAALLSYLPVLMVAGAVTGLATGAAATGTLRALKALPPPKKEKEGEKADSPPIEKGDGA